MTEVGSMADKTTGPAVFAGNGNLTLWLKKVEVWATLKGYTGEKKACALAARLDGPAFESFARMDEGDQKDPDKVAAHLKREFVRGERDRDVAMTELGERKWRERESAAAFAHDVMRLTTLAYPDFPQEARETIQRDNFIKGLTPAMRVAIRSEKANATKTVQDLAEEVTRLEIAGVSRAPSTSARVAQTAAVKDDKETTDLVERITELVESKIRFEESEQAPVQRVQAPQHFTKRNRRRPSYGSNGRDGRWEDRGRDYRRRPKNGSCYICGDQDHFQFDCPYKDKCHRCWKPGHQARECRAPAPAARQRYTDTGRVSALSALVHGLIIVDTKVGKGSYPFLVDTGAEISLIPAHLAIEEHLKTSQQLPQRPVMVDGTSIRCEGTTTIDVEVGPSQTWGTFYVVPDIHQGILGMDVLSRLDVRIDPGKRTLLIDGLEVPRSAWKKTKCKNKGQTKVVKFGRVYASSSKAIAPGEETTLRGHVRTTETSDWTGIVEVLDTVTKKNRTPRMRSASNRRTHKQRSRQGIERDKEPH